MRAPGTLGVDQRAAAERLHQRRPRPPRVKAGGEPDRSALTVLALQQLKHRRSQQRGVGSARRERRAIAGTPDQVTERLREIAALGIERLIIVPCSLDTSPQDLARSDQLFAGEVLPRLRG